MTPEKPKLLRIPQISRTVADLIGTAGQLDLAQVVLMAQRENGNYVFMTTDMTTADANYLVDKCKQMLVGDIGQLVEN